MPDALLHDAATEGIKALLKHGADVMASTESGSVTPLGAAMLRYALLLHACMLRYALLQHMAAMRSAQN